MWEHPEMLNRCDAIRYEFPLSRRTGLLHHAAWLPDGIGRHAGFKLPCPSGVWVQVPRELLWYRFAERHSLPLGDELSDLLPADAHADAARKIAP